MRTFDITEFGAVGDGRTVNTVAIQKAAEACRNAGAGILKVPSGIFLTAPFEIFSGTTLLVEKEGRLLGSPRLEDHLVGQASVGLLYAQDAENIVLTGEGTLDGNGAAFFDPTLLHGVNDDHSHLDTWQKRNGLSYGTKELIHGPLGSPGRPGNMLVLARCRNVRIEKLTVTGSAYWTIHCSDCESVAVEDINIDNELRFPNNDGIHFTTCRRVTVRNCRISSGDDAIAITGFREPMGESQIAFGLTGIAGVCEDIEISDCVLLSRSAAVRVGYGHNPVRNVKLARLEIHGSNRGIGIFARQADVENVTVEDCTIETSLFHGNWWGRGEPVHISSARYPGDPELFQIRNVTLRNIKAIGENAVTLFAEEPGAISDVRMEHVHCTLRRSSLFEAWGGNLDLRPTADPQLSVLAGGTAPLWAIGVSHLTLKDCQWSLENENDPHFSAAPVIREKP